MQVYSFMVILARLNEFDVKCKILPDLMEESSKTERVTSVPAVMLSDELREIAVEEQENQNVEIATPDAPAVSVITTDLNDEISFVDTQPQKKGKFKKLGKGVRRIGRFLTRVFHCGKVED